MKRIIEIAKKLTSGEKGKRRGVHSLHRWRRNGKWIILISVVLLLLFVIPFGYRGIDKQNHRVVSGNTKVERFRDLNEIHLKFARKNGIKPINTEEEFRKSVTNLINKKELIKVNSNKYFVIKKLSHSHPYLTPEASDLLNSIGKKFRKRLDENKLPGYKFQVSSLLRTNESQKRLGRSNRNASRNSSHLYGTSFDITYKSLVRQKFPGIEKEISDAAAIRLLSESIGELRKEGRCKVVTEYNEMCFHITMAK